ncbi:Glutamate 5-kinase [Thecaphora frezii]
MPSRNKPLTNFSPLNQLPRLSLAFPQTHPPSRPQLAFHHLSSPFLSCRHPPPSLFPPLLHPPTAMTPPSTSPSKTIVIKLGTSSILSETTQRPKLSILSSIVETCHALRSLGHRVVIVCSGAIGMGRLRMKLNDKPKSLGERQALAALGQLRLIALWDSLFGNVGIDVAQVLLTRNDIADRPRYQNARTTLHTLLSSFNAIPIVNENDTVSVSELRFGDNDTLSAITAGLVDADYLFLCTDVDGLYTGNPRSDPEARRLGVVADVASARSAVSVATPGSSFGTGGMQTKLIAAELATAAGVSTVILNGSHPENILRIIQTDLDSHVASASMPVGFPSLDQPPHTLFLPKANPLPSRKWSILHALHPAGSLVIDEGAFTRIARADSGGRLLPAGVVGVEGNWERMQAVRLVVRRAVRQAKETVKGETETEAEAEAKAEAATATQSNGEVAQQPAWTFVEVGRALANYTSIESERIKGIKSSQIASVLGYADSDYVTEQVALHTLSLD